MGRSGPREGRALLSAPLCSKLGGDTADTACHLQPCQDQVLLSSPQGAPHHHSRGQWGQRAGDSLRGGSLATTLSKTQPAANLPPFLFLNKHASGSSQSLSFLLVAKARMGVEQGVWVIQPGVQDTILPPLLGSGVSTTGPSPLQMGRLCSLRSAGTCSRPQGGSPHMSYYVGWGVGLRKRGGPGSRGRDLGL